MYSECPVHESSEVARVSQEDNFFPTELGYWGQSTSLINFNLLIDWLFCKVFFSHCGTSKILYLKSYYRSKNTIEK